MSRRTSQKTIALVGVVFLCGVTASAQEKPLGRPKIALALSGGGAFGFAELGAIEWLEEHRIPIDGIAGTSGGALVGGWYATGLDLLTDPEIVHPEPHRGPEDMRLRGVSDVLSGIDVPSMFSGLPDYRTLDMHHKRDVRQFPAGPFFGFAQNSLHITDGMISGQNVQMLLNRIGLAYPTSYLYDGPGAPFDRLPTPFRSVAVDVHAFDYRKWQTIALGGKPLPRAPDYRISLPVAMRASMAIPVVFTPVSIPDIRTPGHVSTYQLFDGGVRDNYPTDVAIDEFRPDVLIGLNFSVDLSLLSTLLRYTGHPSIPRAIEDLSNSFKRGTDAAKQPDESLSIHLATGHYQPYEFERWRQLAWLGYRSMEEYSHGPKGGSLLNLSLPLPRYLEFREKRRKKISKLDPIPSRVVIDPPIPGVRFDPSAFNIDKPLSDPVTRRRLESTLHSLVGQTMQDAIGYEIEGPPGSEVLRLRPQLRYFGPPYMSFGADGHVQSGDRAWANAKAQIWDPGLFPNTELRTTLSVGAALVGSSQLEWRPKGPFFFGPEVAYSHTPQFQFSGGRRMSEIDIDQGEVGFTFGLRPNAQTELKATASLNRIAPDSVFGDHIEVPAGSYRSFDLRLSFDDTNDPLLPKSGSRLDGSVQVFDGFPGTVSSFTQAHLDGTAFVPTSISEDRLFLRGGAGASFGGNAPFATQYRFGGFGLMSGYRIDELRGDGYLYGSVGGMRKFGSLPFYMGDAYLTAWIEGARVGNRGAVDGTLGMLLNSRIGPLFAGVTVADRGVTRLLFMVGSTPFKQPSTLNNFGN